MKNFLYDKENKRLVLVAEMYPTLTQSGKWTNSMSPTPSSESGLIYDTKYVWENVELEEACEETATLDHKVYFIKSGTGPNGIDEKKLLIHLPSNDCYIIYGGGYVYNKPKS